MPAAKIKKTFATIIVLQEKWEYCEEQVWKERIVWEMTVYMDMSCSVQMCVRTDDKEVIILLVLTWRGSHCREKDCVADMSDEVPNLISLH